MFSLTSKLLHKIKACISKEKLVLQPADGVSYFCVLCSGGVADGCSSSCNNGCDGGCSAACRDTCSCSCDDNCSQGCYGSN